MPDQLENPLPPLPDSDLGPGAWVLAQRRNAVSAALEGLDGNPDEAAQALKLGETSNVPAPLAGIDLEGYQRQQKAALVASMLEHNEQLRNYALGHPLAAKVSADDWGQLDSVSEKLHGFSDAIFAPFKHLADWYHNQPSWMQQAIEHEAKTSKDFERIGIKAFFTPEAIERGIDLAQGFGPADIADAGSIAKALDMAKAGEPFIKAGKVPPVGVHPEIDNLHLEQAKLDAKNLDELFSESQKSATRERAPDLFSSFIRQHTDASIGIDAEAVRKLYEDKVPAPDDGLLGWVEGIQDQLALAEHTGGDVEVPLADWLSKADPEMAKELHDSIRVRPGGVTLEEGKGLGKDKVTTAQPIIEELQKLEKEGGTLTEQKNEIVDKFGADSTQASEAFDAIDQNRRAQLEANERLKKVQGEVAPAPVPDTFHGSRHEFEAFDMGKVGTGEGAQAYGHGIYITENPQVADVYKRAGGREPKWVVNGKEIYGEGINGYDDAANPEAAVVYLMRLFHNDRERALSYTDRINDLKRDPEQVDPKFDAKVVDLLKTADIKIPSEGNVYRVRVKAEKEHFLDFDKSLEEQSPHVQKIVEELGQRILGQKGLGTAINWRGEHFYKGLSDRLPKARVSEELAKAGIPGMKYLDQGSRGKGEGTHNYVIYDPSILEITHRNDSPIDSIRRAAKLEEPGFATTDFGKGIIPESAEPAAIRAEEAGVQATTFKVKDALQKIDPDSLASGVPHALYEFFSDRLEEMAGDTNVWVVRPSEMKEINAALGIEKETPGFYHSRQHAIVLREDVAAGAYGHAAAAHLLMHETAHAATMRAMKQFPELNTMVQLLQDETDRLWSERLPEERKEHAYAFKNVDEFMAEAFSNQEFQQKLSVTPISKELADRIGLRGKQSLWDAVKNIVKQLLTKLVGREVPDTILDGLMHLGPAFEEANARIKAKGEGIAAAPPLEPELPGITRVEDRNLFENARAIGMSQKRLKNVMALIEKRRAEDAAHQEGIAQKRAAEQQTKEWKENYAGVREQAGKDVRSRPDIAADLLFRNGELYGDKVPRPKLDSRQLTPEQRAAIPKEYVGEGGIHPDDAAGLFGYQSGDSLVEGLARLHAEREREGLTPAAHLTRLGDVEAERVMRRDYGSLEQNILEEAKDHVISETQLDLLHEYMLALAEHAKAELPLGKDDIKQWVKDQFNRLSVGAHSTDKYLAQSGRAGQDIIDALAEGRPKDALKAQQDQYVNLLLAKEAKGFEKKLKGFLKIAGRFAKREVGGVATSYTNWIHDILMRSMPERFVRRTAEDLQGAIGREDHDTLRGFVQNKSEQFGLPIMLPDFMYEGNWNKPLKDMTVEEATSVMDAVQTLYNLGRKENKFILRGDEQDRVELRDKMLAQAKEQPQRKIKENPTKLGEWWGDIKQIAHKIVQMETSWNRLDGGDKFGLFNRAFAYGASDATHDYSDLIREYGAKLAKLDTPKGLKKKLPSIFRRPSNDQIVDMRRENLIQMMRNIGTQSGLDKLVGGWNGTRPGQVEHELHKARVLNYISQHATKEDWDFVEGEGKVYAEMFEKATEMLHNQGIVPPQRESLRQVQTPFGTKDGWYHPVIYDQVERGSSKKLMGKAFDDMEGLESTGYFRATTAKGWTKARTGYIAPIYLHMDRSAARMTTVLRDVAIRPFIINASKMFYDKTFVHGMRDALGPAFADKLDPFLKSMGGMGNPPLSMADAIGRNMLQTVMRNTIGTLIGGNIHTIEKHSISAAINSIVEVGPLNFAREARLLFTKGDLDPKLTNQQVAMQKSGELRRRLQNAAGTVSGEYERLSPNYTTPSKLRNYIYEYGTAPIGFFDLMSAWPTWTAEYKSALEDLAKLHPGEDIAKYDGLAIDAGNRAVRRAHGSSAISSRPEAMRGGPLARTFTQLYGFFNQAFQRNYEAMWRTGAMARDFKEGEFVEGSKQLGMITLLLFQGVIAPAFVEEMVTPYTNSDRDSLATWAFKTLAMGASGTIPIVREFVHGMISGTSAGFGLLGTQYEQLQSDVRDIKKGTRMMDAEHGGKTIKDFNTLFGMVTGLTNNEIGNLMKSTWDVTHRSKETPKNVIEFGREALTGHARKEQRR